MTISSIWWRHRRAVKNNWRKNFRSQTRRWNKTSFERCFWFLPLSVWIDQTLSTTTPRSTTPVAVTLWEKKFVFSFFEWRTPDHVAFSIPFSTAICRPESAFVATSKRGESVRGHWLIDRLPSGLTSFSSPLLLPSFSFVFCYFYSARDHRQSTGFYCATRPISRSFSPQRTSTPIIINW